MSAYTPFEGEREKVGSTRRGLDPAQGPPAAEKRGKTRSGGMFEIIGFVGVALSCIAYVPQIVHLAVEHCSAGVSVKAWVLWLLAGFLIFLHALTVFDIVFVTLQVVNIAAVTLIIVLGKKYQNMSCESHAPRLNGVQKT